MVIFSAQSFIVSLLPIVMMVIAFWVIQRRRNERRQRDGGLGRRGRKDHLWLIIKEYLKLNDISGVTIEESFAFERPDRKDLHGLIARCEIYKMRLRGQRVGRFLGRVKFPKRFEVEDYFDALEEETFNMNREMHRHVSHAHAVKPHRRDFVERHGKSQPPRRKRYVIIFRMRNPQGGGISNWICLEAELFHNSNRSSNIKDKVIINRRLDYHRELSWLLPLKAQREADRADRARREARSRRRKDRASSLWGLFFGNSTSSSKVK